MVTITQLFPTFAATLGLAEESITQRARFLREAGYLPATVGKRLAYATPRHVASLLAAILVDDRVIYTGTAGEIAHSLRAKNYECNAEKVATPEPGAIFGLAPNHSFVDGLEALIARATQGDIIGPSGFPIEPISVSVERPWAHGRISFRDAAFTLQIDYEPPLPNDVTDHVAIAAAMNARFGGGDLHTKRRIGSTTIYELGAAMTGRTE